MNPEQRQRMKDLAMYAGVRVKHVRKTCGFGRQADFGKFLGGIAATTLSRVERGDSLPGPRLMVALAEECNVNLNWLLTGVGPELEIPPP